MRNQSDGELITQSEEGKRKSFLDCVLKFCLLFLLVGVVYFLLSFPDSKMSYVSGIWTCMAMDFDSGQYYRLFESPDGYGGIRYFPGHAFLQASLMKLTKSPLPAGHLIAAFSIVLLLYSFYEMLKYHQVSNRIALICSICLLAPKFVLDSVVNIKADMLPVALCIGACVLILKKHRWQWLILGGVLLGCSAVTKQTSIMYCGMICIYLCLNKRKLDAMWVGCSTVVVAGSLLFYVNYITHGTFMTVMKETSLAGVSLSETIVNAPVNFLHYLLQPQEAPAILTIATAFIIALMSLRKYRSFGVILFFVVLCGTVAIMGSPGTRSNHFIDIYVASVFVIATVLLHKNASKESVVCGKSVLIATAFLGAVLAIMAPTVGRSWKVALARNSIVSLINRQDPKGPVLCSDPVIDVMRNKRSYLIDSMMFGLKREADSGFYDRFINKLKIQEFDLVVLTRSPQDIGKNEYPTALIGQEALSVFKDSYMPIFSSDIYVVYAKKTPDKR